jgi:2-keto-3-deoxy-6-phosphogluconate aldolase
VVTVRIKHALDARDALAAALVGAGEVVDAVVTEGTTESGAQTLVSMILQSRLH